MIIQTHRLKDTPNSEAERDKMAPLSTCEAAELPDSTYPGNRLPRSFFWRGSNKLAPPPGPQRPHPYSSPSISSLWKTSDDGVGKPTPPPRYPPPTPSDSAEPESLGRSPAPAAPLLRPLTGSSQ